MPIFRTSRLFPLFWIGLAPFLFACGPSEEGAGDAGAALADSGDQRDGGHAGDAGSDGGILTDGGAPDAGSPPDSGIPPDAGPSIPLDAGPTANAYWASVNGDLEDQALVSVLHSALFDTHIELDYGDVLTAYDTTDTGRDGCAGVFDFYSDQCWLADETCGQYSAEGDCFNREHSWPKSWWGGSETHPAYTDLFHVIPADGYVNNLRGNLPFGDVETTTYESSNGSRIGECAQTQALGRCFEPIDALKGDLARIYFYMAVRYEGDFTCCGESAVDGADIETWEEDLLRIWHVMDPVDGPEQARQEAVFGIQGNRNPFVDHPEWADQIADF